MEIAENQIAFCLTSNFDGMQGSWVLYLVFSFVLRAVSADFVDLISDVGILCAGVG